MRLLLAMLLMSAPPASATTITGWPDLTTPTHGGASHPEDAAVVIGVETYEHFPASPYALRNAEAFAGWARITRGIPGHRVQHLRDPDAAEIEAALTRALAQVGPEGTLWVHYSGHAVVSSTDGRHLLLGADASREGGFALRHVLSVEEIQRQLSEDDLAHGLIVVDAGFDGAGRGGELIVGALSNAPSPPPPSHPGVATWLAAGPGEWAGPLMEARMGLFTWHVIGALRGWADGALGVPDGQLTLEEAQHWVRDRIAAVRRQTPSVDPRGTTRAWVLSRPSRPPPTLRQPAPALPMSRPPRVEVIEEEGAPRARQPTSDTELLAELRRGFLEEANQAWMRAYGRALRGDLDGLRLFVQQYGTMSYYHQGRLYDMTAPQVPDARRMLANGGRPSEPLVAAVPLPAQEVRLGSPVGTPGRGASEVLSTVRISRPFAMGRTEVTQGQWATVTGTNPSVDPQPDQPVTGVSWYEAVTFCNALSRLDGFDPAYEIRGRRVTVDLEANGWRLPTEAEWTAAAQAVPPGVTSPCRLGNVRDQQAVPEDEGRCDDGFAGLSPAHVHPANALGLYGLYGNAAEWTADGWATLPGATRTDPEPGNSLLRVVKGASYLTDPSQARVASRVAQQASESRDDLGFRIVRTLPPETVIDPQGAHRTR